MTPWHSDSARTENLLSQFHRSDRVPSTRKISPSLLKSDRVFAYSHQVHRVHQVADFLTEFVIEVLFFSPSVLSETHRLTESTAVHRVHCLHCRPPSPLPSTESRVFSPSDYFSHRVFGRKLTESPSPPSPPSHGFSHRVRDRVNFPESGGLTKMKWNKMKFEMLPVTIASLACIRNIFVLLFHCILSLSFISFISSRLYEVSWTKDRDECTAMTSLTWNQLLLQLSPR